jgi:hypothetical protein
MIYGTGPGRGRWWRWRWRPFVIVLWLRREHGVASVMDQPRPGRVVAVIGEKKR